MPLHSEFPLSPYDELSPDVRWFPAAEELRTTAYRNLMPPLVANIRERWPCCKTACKSSQIPGVNSVQSFPRWTGGYIFENEWQSFRTRQNRDLELKTPLHAYERAGRYTVAAKVIDIFGNGTVTLVPVNVG